MTDFAYDFLTLPLSQTDFVGIKPNATYGMSVIFTELFVESFSVSTVERG